MTPELKLIPTDAATLPVGDREVAGLLAALDVLLGELRALDGIADQKIAAIRRADGKALADCARREEAVIKHVLADGARRGAILAAVAHPLLGGVTSPPSLEAIAQRLREPRSSELRAKSLVLQRVTTELQRKNRLVSDVARQLQEHIRGIFADVAKAAQPAMVYGPRGSSAASGQACCVEAIG